MEKKRIPRFVSEQYPGGARQFKAERRKALQDMRKALVALRRGCVWFPCGSSPVAKIETQMVVIGEAISEKNWGR